MPLPVMTVDDTRLKIVLKQLLRKSKDASTAFAEIAQVLASSVEKNFHQEGRYLAPNSMYGGSSKWQKLADSTVANRARSGRGAHPILQVSGQLASSITTASGPRHAQIGTSLVYGAIHQYGGKAGRGRKVTIPARPFLVVQDEDIDDALDIIARHLTRGVK